MKMKMTESEVMTMTALNKKRKCRNTLYDRGGEKGHISRAKRLIMFHKKERIANKKLCILDASENN